MTSYVSAIPAVSLYLFVISNDMPKMLMNRALGPFIIALILLAAVLGILAWSILILWAALFPRVLMLQTRDSFLHITSNAPGPGSFIEWCAKQPRPLQLANGDIVLAYRCPRIGWLPFHAETAWSPRLQQSEFP